MTNRDFFDHYQVCRKKTGDPIELGRGAMAVTYLADDLNLRRKVALKVIDAAPLTEDQRKKFEDEARAAALLRHRNVAAVHHLGSDETHFFYAMEYIEGETAEAWVDKHGPMPTIEALSVTLQVTRALAAADRRNLTHRDIKPSNLMLCTADDGEWPTVKVIDFGLATAVSAGSEPIVSSTPGFHGTAQYASPEQARQRPVDIRSDIYSLGCSLWFLLTGEPPFTGSLASVFAQHLNVQPPLEKLSRFPRRVRRLLAQMLEKNQERRPHVRALAEQIQSCLGAVERKQALARRCVAPFFAAKERWSSIDVPGRWVTAGLLTGVTLVVAALIVPGSIDINSQAGSARVVGKVVGVPKAQALVASSDVHGVAPPMKSTSAHDATQKGLAIEPPGGTFSQLMLNRTLPPPPNSPGLTSPSIGVAAAQRAIGDSPLNLGAAKSEQQLANDLPRGQVLAPFLGVSPNGPWMVSVANESQRPVVTKRQDATWKHSTRVSNRSRSNRRSGSPRIAAAAKKVIGFFTP